MSMSPPPASLPPSPFSASFLTRRRSLSSAVSSRRRRRCRRGQHRRRDGFGAALRHRSSRVLALLLMMMLFLVRATTTKKGWGLVTTVVVDALLFAPPFLPRSVRQPTCREGSHVGTGRAAAAVSLSSSTSTPGGGRGDDILVAEDRDGGTSESLAVTATPLEGGAGAKPPASASEAKALSHDLSQDELRQIMELVSYGDDNDNDDAALASRVEAALPALSPALLVKLHKYLAEGEEDDNEAASARDEPQTAGAAIRRAARAVQRAVEARRARGAQLLQRLLGAGEIRRLDSLIGRAGRDGDLDPAFFQVLQVNLNDARRNQQQAEASGDAGGGAGASSSSAEGSSSAVAASDAAASRYQILSHIYTRCQEEVEKAMPAGMALLNKLLRTPEASIRTNIISHYLTPAKQTITSPDGRTITLSGAAGSASLVSLDDLIGAVTTFVSQVRALEEQQQQQQGTSSNGVMVETARQLCKEVLAIVAESYGPESPQVDRLKEGLQPVFRPTESVPSSSSSTGSSTTETNDVA